MAYLWDSNILRHYLDDHPLLLENLKRVDHDEILIPIIVHAEQTRGRIDGLLKAVPRNLLQAQQRLLLTQQMLGEFKILHLDTDTIALAERLKRQIKTRKNYADFLIAAQALAGRHVLVTRNTKDFADIIPNQQLQNWIDGRAS
jgi:predicted nucleic acid-binding protein